MRIRAGFLSAILVFGWASACLAAPDQTMSIEPVAVSGETISASDENARNNEISTKFNAHTHADVSTFTTNTFTIGDGAVGNKTYAVDTDQSNNPGLRYNTTTDVWTLSNDGTTYLAALHASDSNALASGNMLYGGTSSGAVVSAGSGTNGQILIGSSSGPPRLASITGSGGVSIANGDGSIDVRHAVQGFAAPALTLGTANTAGSASTVFASNSTVAAFDATVPENVGTANATGSASVAARRDHVHRGSGWIFVETLTLSGTGVSTSTLSTSSDTFMCVLENIASSAGNMILRFNGDATAAAYRYTSIATATLADASGDVFILGPATTGLSGIITFFRPIGTDSGHPVHFGIASDSIADTLPFGRGSWTVASAITTADFNSASGNVSGQVHVFRLSDQ